MGNSLRCCLACVLPCGALDLIRIVHLNGNVEEITGPVTAGEILKANPNHILSKPCSQGVVRKILILSPDSELKRGSIYFLIPSASLPVEKKKKGCAATAAAADLKSSSKKKSNKKVEEKVSSEDYCDKYLANVISESEKKSSRRERRHRKSRSRAVVEWQPQLDSIAED